MTVEGELPIVSWLEQRGRQIERKVRATALELYLLGCLWAALRSGPPGCGQRDIGDLGHGLINIPWVGASACRTVRVLLNC